MRKWVYRIPEEGSGEIKYGAQLIVRESQAAVFLLQRKGLRCFWAWPSHAPLPGNIPVLTKILTIPWGMTSPLRAEVYFVDPKVFPNLKSGHQRPSGV